MKKIQATGTVSGEKITLIQISKAKAAKLFAAGDTVYIQSSNMHPFGIWQSICPIKLDAEQIKADRQHNLFCINLYKNSIAELTAQNEEWSKSVIAEYEAKLQEHENKVINEVTQFNQVLNNYAYYNCDNERGKYIHFYQSI